MRILEPYTCERRCIDMEVHEPHRNIIIINQDKIQLAKCRAILDRESRQVLWDSSSSNDTIFAVSCTYVRNSSVAGQFRAWDCFNSALLNSSEFSKSFTLGQLLSIYSNNATSRRFSTTTGQTIPLEHELTIYNKSRLLVNMEVNSNIYI